MVCEKNTHAMTLVDPYVVYENNRHEMTLDVVNERIHISMTMVDPYVVCEKNRHAMTLAVVCEKNKHAMTLWIHMWFVERTDMQ